MKKFILKASYVLKHHIKLFYYGWVIKSVSKTYQHSAQKTGKRILFYTLRTTPENPLLYFENIIAHSLNARGADAKILLCDNVLSSCDADNIGVNHKFFCRVCNAYRPKIAQILNVPVLNFSEFISEQKKTEITEMIDKLDYAQYKKFTYRGINVGFSAESSVIRYFRKGFVEDNMEFKNKFKECLINASVVTEIANSVYERIKPDLVVTLHGIYSTWEPFYYYFRSKGISVIVYELCVSELETMKFTKNSRNFESIGNEFWKKNISLSVKENLELDKLLSRRFSFIGGVVSLFNNDIDKTFPKELIIKEIISQTYKRRYILFTNVAWDDALISPDRIFKNIFDWVFETIEFFSVHPDYQLIIKTHPAEAWEKNTLSLITIIKDKFPNLPENIFILPPNTAVKAYDLFDIVDAGLVYNSTTGLEMALKGIPALVVGNNAYTGKEGVVYKIRDKEEYFRLLEDLEPVKKFAEEHIDIARRYAHLYFIKSEIPICFFKKDKWAQIDWFRLKDLNKMMKKDIHIDHLCNCILNGEEILRPG